jgi:hypothetical protein
MSVRRLVILAACLAGTAQAGDVRPIVKAGIDTGGDTIVTAVFTNGDTKRVRANEGVFLGGGASWVNDAKDIEVEVAATYKIALIDADNGDIDWTRVPLDALVFYRTHNFRVGGGLTYHINPKIDGSGDVRNLNIDFKDALGLILQADWRITQKINLGLRYTNLEYKAEAPASGTAKSNGVGLAFSMRF